MLARLVLLASAAYFLFRALLALLARFLRRKYNLSADSIGLLSLGGVQWDARAQSVAFRAKVARVHLQYAKSELQLPRRVIRLHILRPSLFIVLAQHSSNATDSASAKTTTEPAAASASVKSRLRTASPPSVTSLLGLFMIKQIKTLLYHFLIYVLVRWVDICIVQPEITVQCTIGNDRYTVCYSQESITVGASLIGKALHVSPQSSPSSSQPALSITTDSSLHYTLTGEMEKSDRIELSIQLSPFTTVLSIHPIVNGNVIESPTYHQNIVGNTTTTEVHRIRVIYALSLLQFRLVYPHIYIDVAAMTLRADACLHLYRLVTLLKKLELYHLVSSHKRTDESLLKSNNPYESGDHARLLTQPRLIHLNINNLAIIYSFSYDRNPIDELTVSLSTIELLYCTTTPGILSFPPPMGTTMDVQFRLSDINIFTLINTHEKNYLHLSQLTLAAHVTHSNTFTSSSSNKISSDGQSTIHFDLQLQSLHILADRLLLCSLDKIYIILEIFLPQLSTIKLSSSSSSITHTSSGNTNLLEPTNTLQLALSKFIIQYTAKLVDTKISLQVSRTSNTIDACYIIDFSMPEVTLKALQSLQYRSKNSDSISSYEFPLRHIETHIKLSDLTVKVSENIINSMIYDIIKIELVHCDGVVLLPLITVHPDSPIEPLSPTLQLTSDAKWDIGMSHLQVRLMLLDLTIDILKGVQCLTNDTLRRVCMFTSLLKTNESNKATTTSSIETFNNRSSALLLPHSWQWQALLTIDKIDFLLATSITDQPSHCLGFGLTLSKVSAQVSYKSQVTQKLLHLSDSLNKHSDARPRLLYIDDKMMIIEWTCLCEIVTLHLVELPMNQYTFTTPYRCVAPLLLLPRMCCELKHTMEYITRAIDTRPSRISTCKAVASIEGDTVIKYSLGHHLAITEIIKQALTLRDYFSLPESITSNAVKQHSPRSRSHEKRRLHVNAPTNDEFLQQHTEFVFEGDAVSIDLVLPDEVRLCISFSEISAIYNLSVDSEARLHQLEISGGCKDMLVAANKSTTTLAGEAVAAQSLFIDEFAPPDIDDELYRLVTVPQVNIVWRKTQMGGLLMQQNRHLHHHHSHHSQDTHQDEIEVTLMGEFAFTVPYGYMLKDVTWNASIAFKSCKMMLLSALRRVDVPAKDEVSATPSVSIHIPLFTVAFRDSPFEVKLSSIFTVGMTEQQRRLTQQSALSQKISELEAAIRKLQHDQTMSNDDATTQILASEIISLSLCITTMWNELYHFHSQEWINIRRVPLTSPSPKTSDIFYASFDGILIHLSKPTLILPSISATLSQLDPATPFTINYDLLLAKDLRLSLKGYTLRVRDYPLPLMHFHATQPSPHHPSSQYLQQEQTHHHHQAEHIVIKGLFIISEPVPAPTSTYQLPVDLEWRGCTHTITKNLSPLKFYTDVTMSISGPSISAICWGSAYEPALSDVGRIFDTFHKSLATPGDPLPWWDKFRWLMHGCMQWQFTNEAMFKFRFLGSKNPYSTLLYGGGSPGVDIVTKGNTSIWLGGHKKHSQAHQSKRQYPIGLATEQLAIVIPQEVIGENVAQSQLDCLLADDGEYFMRFIGDALMGVEPHFLSDENVPQKLHSQIHIHGPSYVCSEQEESDAFAGFRSKSLETLFYFHATPITNVSETNTIASTADSIYLYHNDVHLTPATVQYLVEFVQFNIGSKSTPLRKGKLFPLTSSLHTNKKFSLLLTSYFLNVSIEPVVLYFLHKQNAVLSPDDAVGLQFLIQHCHVDFHCARYRPHETHLNPAPWYVDTTEVDFKHVEGRTAQLLQQVFAADGSNGHGLGAPVQDTTNTHEKITIKCLDSAASFFVVFEPFLWTPRLSYCRKSDVDYGRPSKFGQDANNVQLKFLQRRLNDINYEIAALKEQLDRTPAMATRMMEPETVFDFEQRLALLWRQQAIISQHTQVLLKNGRQSTSFLQEHLRFLLDSTLPRAGSAAAADHTHFMHQFCIHDAHLRWKASTRNIIFRCIDQQQQFHAVQHYMSNASLKVLRRLMEATTQLEHKLNVPSSRSSIGASRSTSHINIDQEFTAQLLKKLIDDVHNLVITDDTADTAPKRETIAEMEELTAAQQAGNVAHNMVVMFINPQIKLECTVDPFGPNGCCIVAAESMCLTQFGIMASKELVSTMTVMKIGDAQFSVAADPASAALMGIRAPYLVDDYVPWLPTECIISPELSLRGYAKVVERVQVSLYHKKLNILSVDTISQQISHTSNSNSNSTKIATDSIGNSNYGSNNNIDSWHLDFSPCAIAADALAFSVLYDVISKLLLYSEPSRQVRQEQLDTILLATQAEDVHVVVDSISRLRQKIRELSVALSYDAVVLTRDDLSVDAFTTWVRLGKRLSEAREDLAIVMEALKTIMNGRSAPQDCSRPTYQTNITASSIVWDMLDDQRVAFCQFGLDKIDFAMTDHSDDMRIFTIEIDAITGINKIPNSPYIDMLMPYVAADDRSFDFSRNKMMRVYWRAKPPVAGIPVVDHFEVNIFPLQVQLTHEAGKQVIHYVFPQKSTSSNTNSGGSGDDSGGTEGSNGSTMSDINVLERSVPALSSSVASSASIVSPHGQGPSGRKNSIRPTFVEAVDGSHMLEYVSTRKEIAKTSDTLRQMRHRASANKTFIYIKVPGAQHCFSYKGSKEKNIEDLHQFVLTTPTLEYRNKTWTWLEFMTHVRKDIIRAVLSQAGSLVKEKLFARKPGIAPSASSTSLSWQTGLGSVHARSKSDDAQINPDSGNAVRARAMSVRRRPPHPEHPISSHSDIHSRANLPKSGSIVSFVGKDDLDKARLLFGKSYIPLLIRVSAGDARNNL